MSSIPLYNERFRRPMVGFVELLRKNAGGAFREKDEYAPFMYRAIVVAMDTEGGKLETPDGVPEGPNLSQRLHDSKGALLAEYTIKPTLGPRNPKNSVRAKVISSDIDQFVDSDHLRTYWPMFPGADNPGPGELVYVAFEDENMSHGLWISKVPNDIASDNVNAVSVADLMMGRTETTKTTLFSDTTPTAPADPFGPVIKEPDRLTNLWK